MSLMFYNVSKITSLDLSNFDTRKVVNMKSMFQYCTNIKKLDLSNFRTPSLKIMELQFYECNRLTSLDISNFDTSQVTSMYYLFNHCNDLPFLDLSSFDTSNVYTMAFMFGSTFNLTSIKLENFRTPSLKDANNMFRKAQSLISLDLNHFDTSKVTSMFYMFWGCQKLKDLKISNFQTPLVETMKEMFCNCFSLTSLDIPGFYTPKVTNMYAMFYYTYNLKSINFPKIDTSSLTDMRGLFCNNPKLEYINIKNYNEVKGNYYYVVQSLDLVPENVVVCLQSNVISKFWTVLVTKRCHTIYCGDDWKTKQKKMVYGTNLTCVQDCSDYEFEYDGWCYSSCPENANFCPTDSPETTSVATTDNPEPTTIVTHVTTQLAVETEPPTTVLTQAPTTVLTQAPTTILTQAPTTVLTQALTTILTQVPASILTQAPTKAPTTSTVSTETLDENDAKTSTSVNQADLPNESTNVVENTSDNISKESTNDFDKASNTISDNSLNSITTEKINDDLTNNISFVNNEDLYQYIIENYVKGDSVNDTDGHVVEDENSHSYHITTSKIDKLNIYEKFNNSKRVSRIDLGNCETILKNYYHIDQNDSLIILTFEKVTNVSTERAMLYEVFEPYNKTKLNLSICDNTTISIFVPVVLSEKFKNLYNQAKESGYDIFDRRGAFYNDMCTPFTTPNGTDILLSDRVTYYYYNSETLCQSNCDFSNYDFETQYLECSCDTSNSEIPNKDIESLTRKTIYQSFYDVLRFSNYKVLWCYKLAFHIDSVTINKGSIIAIAYFIIYFIFLLIYCCKGIDPFRLAIANKLKNHFMAPNKDLNNALVKDNKKVKKKNTNHNYELSTKRKIKSEQNAPKLIINKNIKIINIKHFPPKKNVKSIDIFSPNNKSSQNNKSSRNKIKPLKNKQQKWNSISENNMLILSKGTSSKTEKFNFNEKYKNKVMDTKIPTDKEKKLDDFELNDLDYDEAIKLDKRGLCKTYWSTLKREHLIIFTFFIRNDYNLIYVKFARFMFLLCTDMSMNVFFFADETMHKMFLDYGKYNFLIQIVQIVISTIISQFIEVFICFLSLTDKHFYEIKNLEKDEKDKMLSIVQCVNRKITFFYITTFLMFAFYWYSIACFCAVYRNTQIAFIRNSLSSFALGLLYPFILYFFPAFLRIISLRAGKVKLSCSCIYKLSDLIPFF